MKLVSVNGKGDLAMSHKQDIGQQFFFVKTTKSGLAYLQSTENPKHFISVPMKNVDEIHTQTSN
jgi:hypothetical protein